MIKKRVSETVTAQEVSKYGVFSGPYFRVFGHFWHSEILHYIKQTMPGSLQKLFNFQMQKE